MSSNKTIYKIKCPFACDFCDKQVLEVRTFKGHESGRKYAQGSCGIDIRPTNFFADKILGKSHSAIEHSANSTMQDTPKAQNTDNTDNLQENSCKGLHSANSTMQTDEKPAEPPKEEVDYFAILGGE